MAEVSGRDDAIVDEGMRNARKGGPSATTPVIADKRGGTFKYERMNASNGDDSHFVANIGASITTEEVSHEQRQSPTCMSSIPRIWR